MLEARVDKLEKSNMDAIGVLSRIELKLNDIEHELKAKANTVDIIRLEAKIDSKASAVELAEIKGKISQIPTFWQQMMIVLGVAGSIFAILKFGIK